MEMHLALIVDGYKFIETGYNFNQLPNSIAQLALPEWKLQSRDLVSLTTMHVTGTEPHSEFDCLAVLMSDGSTVPLCFNEEGIVNVESNQLPADLNESCDDPPHIDGLITFDDIPNASIGYEDCYHVIMEWNTCQMTGDDTANASILLRLFDFGFGDELGSLVSNQISLSNYDTTNIPLSSFTPLP